MENFGEYLDRLSCFSGVECLCWAGDRFWDYREYVNFNPARENEAFRSSLFAAADVQEAPLIRVDRLDVAFAVIRQEVDCARWAYFILGPMALRPLSGAERHSFYRNHGMRGGGERPIPVVHLIRVLELVELAAGIITEKQYSHETLLQANGLDGSRYDGKRELANLESPSHHTYEEEQRILRAVREGRGEDAVASSMMIDGRLGLLSREDWLQWQKGAVIAIALATRAAMEGGLSPTVAYQISDEYLRACDDCRGAGEFIDCRNRALRELSDRVWAEQSRNPRSGDVERACDYIEKNYREKIRMEELAGLRGCGAGHLSRRFSREMGVAMQDYVVQVRVRHAAELLAHSELRLAEIGDYVNFPTQSYFSKMFKRHTGMTPSQYREAHRPKEIGENTP